MECTQKKHLDQLHNLVISVSLQVYPTYARTTGIGIANAVGNIGGMISPVLVVKLITNCQQMPVIVLLDCVMAVAGISALLFSVETNRRELVDTVAASDSVVIS